MVVLCAELPWMTSCALLADPKLHRTELCAMFVGSPLLLVHLCTVALLLVDTALPHGTRNVGAVSARDAG